MVILRGLGVMVGVRVKLWGEDYGSETEESSGGEGGQVKTRSQWAKLAKEKTH